MSKEHYEASREVSEAIYFVFVRKPTKSDLFGRSCHVVRVSGDTTRIADLRSSVLRKTYFSTYTDIYVGAVL